MNIPPPPNTPKDIPVSKGRYAQYDDRALWEHVADKVNEMYQEWPEVKATAFAQPRMETKLDLALRPRMVHPAVQGVVAFAAILWTVCLVLIAVSVVHPSPARAFVPTVEAHR